MPIINVVAILKGHKARSSLLENRVLIKLGKINISTGILATPRVPAPLLTTDCSQISTKDFIA